MAILAKLKTSKKERSTGREGVEQRLRRKMKERLIEQRDFAAADLAGEQIIRTTTKFIPNKETGELIRQEVPKRIKRWYWKEPDGNVCMKLFYGSSVVSLNGDSTTIEVKEFGKLPETIDLVIEAVEAGELDEVLKFAMTERRTKLRGIK
tara:strand:+ start:7010 stop:7459 length:450 start_codon:yes stop_codon:yes gene_type:complete